jgi:hypothetical protein
MRFKVVETRCVSRREEQLALLRTAILPVLLWFVILKREFLGPPVASNQPCLPMHSG